MKFKLRFNGIEPELTTIRVKGNCTYTNTISLFYPFRVLRLKIRNYLTKRYLSGLGYTLIKCEGCGEGWAEWHIKNPNAWETGTLDVCKNCVEFYDFRLSKVRLEIKWRQDGDENLYRN